MSEWHFGQQVVSSNRMSLEEYRAERERIRETYGDSSVEAAAKRDQALARLAYRSGLSQEVLAKEEGQKQSIISYRLRFGRFLDFTTTVVSHSRASSSMSRSTARKRARSLVSALSVCDGDVMERHPSGSYFPALTDAWQGLDEGEKRAFAEHNVPVVEQMQQTVPGVGRACGTHLRRMKPYLEGEQSGDLYGGR